MSSTGRVSLTEHGGYGEEEDYDDDGSRGLPPVREVRSELRREVLLAHANEQGEMRRAVPRLAAPRPAPVDAMDAGVVMEGYMQQRTRNKVFKKWKKRYFVVDAQRQQLRYFMSVVRSFGARERLGPPMTRRAA